MNRDTEWRIELRAEEQPSTPELGKKKTNETNKERGQVLARRSGSGTSARRQPPRSSGVRVMTLDGGTEASTPGAVTTRLPSPPTAALATQRPGTGALPSSPHEHTHAPAGAVTEPPSRAIARSLLADLLTTAVYTVRPCSDTGTMATAGDDRSAKRPRSPFRTIDGTVRLRVALTGTMVVVVVGILSLALPLPVSSFATTLHQAHAHICCVLWCWCMGT